MSVEPPADAPQPDGPQPDVPEAHAAKADESQTDESQADVQQPDSSEVDAPQRLIEERDHLLRSIRDLDREYSFGDMDEADHNRLRQEYTVRAADVLRSIETGSIEVGSVGVGSVGVDATKAVAHGRPAGAGRWKTVGIFGTVVLFAVVSGFMVARASGQRGSNPITGSQGSIREQLATCQPLSFQEPENGISCYADLLKVAPENPEALTYQGWAYVRAGKVDEGGANFAKVVKLDPDYPDVRVFMAIVASRAGDFAKAAEELSLFYKNDPSPMAIQVLQSQGLERDIFFGSIPATVRGCWQKAAEANKDSKQLGEKFYGTLGSCLDAALSGAPEDVDALVSRAFAAAGSASTAQSSTVDAATPYLDRALAVEPDDGNALVLRASLSAANGDPDAARADLEKLRTLPRPTISFLTGGPEQISETL